MNLRYVLVDICYFAQNNAKDLVRSSDKDFLMNHISYIVSCFLAQNTVNGDEGVESDIVLDLLTGEFLIKDEWHIKINDIINSFGGEK